MTSPVEIRPARDAAEREAAFALRRAVFVGEQGVPLPAELDEHEDSATHLLAHAADGAVVGTARWRRHGPAGGERLGKIERVAVARVERGRGIGVALIEAALADLRAAGLDGAVLHAQAHARAFYERLGFAAEGEPFDEEGIAHVRMRRAL